MNIPGTILKPNNCFASWSLPNIFSHKLYYLVLIKIQKVIYFSNLRWRLWGSGNLVQSPGSSLSIIPKSGLFLFQHRSTSWRARGDTGLFHCPYPHLPKVTRSVFNYISLIFSIIHCLPTQKSPFIVAAMASQWISAPPSCKDKLLFEAHLPQSIPPPATL